MPTEGETILEYVNEYGKFDITDGASQITKLRFLKRKKRNSKRGQRINNKRGVISSNQKPLVYFRLSTYCITFQAVKYNIS